MKRFLALMLVFFAGASAYAQIGLPPENTLQALPQAVQEGDAYKMDGARFTLEARNNVLYEVSGQAALTDAGTQSLATLVGAATGYGESIATPLAEFLGARAGELVGQVRSSWRFKSLSLRWTSLGDVSGTPGTSGGDASGGATSGGAVSGGAMSGLQATFSLALQEVPTDLFPVGTHTLGPSDARYVIREFSDFQCPFCAQYATQTLPGLKETLLSRGDVRFEYHDFPLQSIHANAVPAAEAAECVVAANTPDAFWTYHDALFERQQAWAGLSDPTAYFVRLAQDVGLETDGLEACIQNRTFSSEIEAAYQAAVTLGLRGTPSVFVNGFRVENFNDPASYARAFSLVDAFSDGGSGGVSSGGDSGGIGGGTGGGSN